MQRSSKKTAHSEFPTYEFNEDEFTGNRNMVETYQQSETEASFSGETGAISGSITPPRRNQPNSKQKLPVSDLNNQRLESPSVNNAPVPNTGEAISQTQQTDGVKHGSRSARNDQPQLYQVNANPNNFGRRGANVIHENPNPLHEQVERVSSHAGGINETLHHRGASSNQQPLMQPAYVGIEGTDSSHGEADRATDAPAQPTRSSSFPLIMEAIHPFPLALAERIPESANHAAQSFHSENEVTSAEANQTHGHVGSSQQAELQGPPLESLNRHKRVMSADQLEQNGTGNNNVQDNQQALPYPNLFPQNLSGRGFWNEGSAQINQQLPSWLSTTKNDPYRPLSPSGSSEVNPFKATGSSGPQCYNFMSPRASAPLRPTPLNNPLQQINQDPNMPNATDSVLHHPSVFPRSPIPMQPMPQHYSYQHDQVQMAPGAYNSQTFNSFLPESSTPLNLRTPIPRPNNHQVNPLDVSDFHYRSPVQPRASLPSSRGFVFQDSSDHHQDHRLNPAAKLMTNQIGGQSSNFTLQESPIYSGSQLFPAHQQASNQFSMNPATPISQNQNSELPENPILSGLPTAEQQRVLNQTARPIPRYARTGNALTTLVFNSLLEADKNGGTKSPYQIDPSSLTLSGQDEQGSSRRRRGHARSRFEAGESSSFKRFRRESNMPQAASSTAEPVVDTSLSLQNNETTTAEVMASLDLDPRAIKNSLYDPIFEGLGLHIDPHLRLFARNN